MSATASQQLAQVLAEIGRRDVEHADAMARLRAEAVRLHTQASAEALQAERDKVVHFDREEARMLRALAEYCARGYMGPHAKTLEMIRTKVPR